MQDSTMTLFVIISKNSSLLISLFQDSPQEYSDEAYDKASDLRPRKADNEKRKGF